MNARAVIKDGLNRRHLRGVARGDRPSQGFGPASARPANGRLRGFSLPEVLVAIFLMGFVVVALYTAFTQGTVITRMAREDVRATHILLETSESLRMCGWQQVGSRLPPTFTAPYDPAMGNSGVVYTGSILIEDAPMASLYGNNLKQAIIRLEWKTGKLVRQRELKTFIARYGLQTYVN